MAEDTVILSVRVEPAIRDAVERYQQAVSQQVRGLKVSRNDALRLLLLRGLEAEGMAVDLGDAPPPR